MAFVSEAFQQASMDLCLVPLFHSQSQFSWSVVFSLFYVFVLIFDSQWTRQFVMTEHLSKLEISLTTFNETLSPSFSKVGDDGITSIMFKLVLGIVVVLSAEHVA